MVFIRDLCVRSWAKERGRRFCCLLPLLQDEQGERRRDLTSFPAPALFFPSSPSSSLLPSSVFSVCRAEGEGGRMKKSERWEEEEERGWRRHGRKTEGGGEEKRRRMQQINCLRAPPPTSPILERGRRKGSLLGRYIRRRMCRACQSQRGGRGEGRLCHFPRHAPSLSSYHMA